MCVRDCEFVCSWACVTVCLYAGRACDSLSVSECVCEGEGVWVSVGVSVHECMCECIRGCGCVGVLVCLVA